MASLPPYSDGVSLNLDELLYYQQHAVKWLPPAKSLWSQLLGQHQSRQLGRGMDFAEVRQYQPGDDIRAIDWRVTARTGKPHTKLFTEERERPVVLYLDLSASMLFGSTLMLKSVLMAHMASLISWLAVAQQDRIGAVIDTGTELIEIKPTARRRGPLTIIQKLIEVHQRQLAMPQPATAQSMAHAMHTLNRLCPKGSEIVFISDFVRFSDEHNVQLSRLKQHNRIRFVHVSDPLETGQTHFRGVEQVSNHKQTQWLDFSSRKTRTEIENAFQHKLQGLQNMALKLGISYSALTSSQQLLKQISG